MRNHRTIAIVALAAAFLFAWPHQSTQCDTAQFPNIGTVSVRATIEVEIFGYGIYDYVVSGSCELSWSDPYIDIDGLTTIDTEILAMELTGEGAVINQQGGLPSPGRIKGPEPGIDFPAESFFDVFTEVEFSGVMPGDILHNDIPDHIEGIVDDFPSYFDPYDSPAPVPMTPLLNDMSVVVGMMRFVELEMTPYYPPEMHIILDKMKGSDILEPYRYDEDLYRVEAEVSGPHEVTEVEFSYRPAGSPEPWTIFAVDTDGSAESFSTVEDKGEGDGWAAYLDRWTFPVDGELYEFQAVANVTGFGPVGGLSEPVRIYSTPPFPEITSVPVDSAKTSRGDSIIILLARLIKNLYAPSPARVQVFPFGVDFKRTLTPVNQLGMGSDTTLNEKSCGPAAAASCLKYFADNGHPELEHPNGDTSKPEQSGEDMAKELRGAMGTNSTDGTTPGGMVNGIKSYLNSHGKTGWTVEKTDIENYLDVGDMFDEFEADGEDVMMVVENTLPNGKTVQHCVTLGSKGSTVYGFESGPIMGTAVSYRLDFMDPYGGEGTEQHEYNVGSDSNGKPTLKGYRLDTLATSDAVIKKFIKVSPPEESPGSSRAAFPAQADPGWIEVDSGFMTGGGVIDTFYWDQTGFPGGLYLLELVTETPEGMECRDLRLFGIAEYIVDAEPPTPETPTKLMGSYPNPFNPTTTIEFYLARDTKVDLTIYDAAGRTVRHLVRDRFMYGGTHQIVWNGIKDGGGTVASGVYFYRLRADGVELSSKLVLMR